MFVEHEDDLRIVYASIRTHGRTCTDRETDRQTEIERETHTADGLAKYYGTSTHTRTCR
jgi:hypothetical protein